MGLMSRVMKAAVCRRFGEPLSIEDVAIAEPGDGEVRVRIAACAICHSDISYIDGAWGGELPAVYGHEAAGVVERVGPGVSNPRPGDRVLVTLIRSCGACHFCARGERVSCEADFPLAHESPLATRDRRSIGHGLGTGAFAEYAVVDASQTAKLPQDVPLDSASLLSCGVITGLGAVVNTARVPPGSDVAVVGAGGVGLNAIQGARLCGARRIIAVDPVAAKLDAAKSFGATDVVDSGADDARRKVRALTAGRGVDYAFVAVGLKPAVEFAARLIRRGGCLVIVGMTPAGVKVEYEPLGLAFLSHRILGSHMGDTRLDVDIPILVDLYRQGRLKLDELISARYALQDINEAIDAVKAGKALRNVVVFDADLATPPERPGRG